MSWPTATIPFDFGNGNTLTVSRLTGRVLSRIESRLREQRIAAVKFAFPGDNARIMEEVRRDIPMQEVIDHVQSMSGAVDVCVQCIIESNPAMPIDEAHALCGDVHQINALAATIFADAMPVQDDPTKRLGSPVQQSQGTPQTNQASPSSISSSTSSHSADSEKTPG